MKRSGDDDALNVGSVGKKRSKHYPQIWSFKQLGRGGFIYSWRSGDWKKKSSGLALIRGSLHVPKWPPCLLAMWSCRSPFKNFTVIPFLWSWVGLPDSLSTRSLWMWCMASKPWSEEGRHHRQGSASLVCRSRDCLGQWLTFSYLALTGTDIRAAFCQWNPGSGLLHSSVSPCQYPPSLIGMLHNLQSDLCKHPSSATLASSSYSATPIPLASFVSVISSCSGSLIVKSLFHVCILHPFHLN